MTCGREGLVRLWMQIRHPCEQIIHTKATTIATLRMQRCPFLGPAKEWILSWGGKKPIHLLDETTRSFLEDGDTVIIVGFAEKDGIRVDFGEVRGTVLPAR